MNSLGSRKQLLITESELNRAQLLGDLAELTAGVRTLTVRAKSFGSIASSGAMLAAGLAAFRRAGGATVKPSWWRTILKGAGMVSTLWLAFRSRSPDYQEKRPNSRAKPDRISAESPISRPLTS